MWLSLEKGHCGNGQVNTKGEIMADIEVGGARWSGRRDDESPVKKKRRGSLLKEKRSGRVEQGDAGRWSWSWSWSYRSALELSSALEQVAGVVVGAGVVNLKDN
ncbi:hypothetical protein Q3G72_032122 [Acer saccharum]|nr:hypothetical protein Q3G72_032122 [Acer saccharum]